MGIDVWEVIEAAKTKPFGFTPFYPGPGLGGHCIPVDPLYLSWKAREHEISTRFIELAGEINTRMPHYVIDKLARALDNRFGKGLRDAPFHNARISLRPSVGSLTKDQRRQRRYRRRETKRPLYPIVFWNLISSGGPPGPEGMASQPPLREWPPYS